MLLLLLLQKQNTYQQSNIHFPLVFHIRKKNTSSSHHHQHPATKTTAVATTTKTMETFTTDGK